MKLAINLPLMVGLAGLWRGLRACARCRLGARSACSICFVESNGANNALKTRTEMIVAMLEGRDPGPTTFSIANGLKDLRTMVATGAAKGADMPATKAALAAFEEANAKGFGGGDGARIPVYWSGRKTS